MSEQQDFFDNLKVIENDSVTGNIIMEHQETGQKFGLKEIQIENNNYDDSVFYLSEREKLNSKYIINLYTTIQQYQNDKLAVIFENWVLNFHDQLESRCRTDQFWSEEELVNTLETTVQGVLTLHENGIYHGNLSTKSIVFCEDNNVKLIDQFVFSQQYALESPDNIKNNHASFNHFLEPQLLLEHYVNDEISNTNIENDLWAVGLIFLQASCLESSASLYDYQNRQFNFDLLDQRLEFVKDKYSIQFVAFLTQLLSLDRNQRILFINKIQSIDEFNIYDIYYGQQQSPDNEQSSVINKQESNRDDESLITNVGTIDISHIMGNIDQYNYIGERDNTGRKQGFGILQLLVEAEFSGKENIVIYQGMFVDNVIHGLGRLTNIPQKTCNNVKVNEILAQSLWTEIEGMFQNECVEGQARVSYQDGLVMYGGYVSGMVEGVASLAVDNQYSVLNVVDQVVVKQNTISL